MAKTLQPPSSIVEVLADDSRQTPQNSGSQITVSNVTPGQVAINNPMRSFLVLSNTDTTAIIYLGGNKNIAVGQGIPLYPKSYLWIGRSTDMPYVGELWAISDTAGGTNLAIFEV